MTTHTATTKSVSRASQYWALTKPRVTQLAVFCAVIGMFLASDGMPDWRLLVAATVGIWLLAGAAFAVNCLAEREIDARMARTARRPMAMGDISVMQTVVFATVIGGAGMWILYALVNPLTMWLTFVTFVGYAIIYTMILKPATPQNIVIGGLSGAMPPALGWAAVANDVPMQAWLLVLIIFVWTPPHFWALAMYRRDDYAKSGLPMLPVTHGMQFTQFHVWLYSIALAATTLLPYAVHMSGLIYLASAVVLNAVFLHHAWKIYRHYTDLIARKAFTWSIIYLSLLFVALLVDHYYKF
ncbi:protoheme IX farnesyltransferase [Duganella sp. BJB488]|uniref:heme o synthase n=1 Tax=unclassified Duganella TaxID=2636909 RepID=UPI000E341755|nr:MULTISPECIES: heme o synthase [unclassified Duganella]NVD70219.1 protoheme IX farnesyltransferase [Duganella sp. BJB1802]RFP22880.1 protoheme IX farnesyltransferase [Duganella sp. BJB489]RFP25044.1 protoheme IX farnesyltransferase [Duganella sp. BJB488]RFP33879.1 protoheme IX farnesyltransferase [Duganella sp. BJB480]